MNEVSIVVHGGAGPDSDFIAKNSDAYKDGLKKARDIGFKILSEGGEAVEAVEAAVNSLEDNSLFNAGRGSALNEHAEVEMDASIMRGKDLKAGAVCIVKNVKNPVSLARTIMEKSKHIYLGGTGALEFARKHGLTIMPDAYFITDHAFEQYLSALNDKKNNLNDAAEFSLRIKSYGTVGAVARDKNGNLASATSTGGIENKSCGRIGDSSMIGTGCYANNETCAISATGDGEYIIINVLGFHISSLMRYKNLNIKDASKYFITEELKVKNGDVGFIGVDKNGNISMEFNSERMHRAWITSSGEEGVAIY